LAPGLQLSHFHTIFGGWWLLPRQGELGVFSLRVLGHWGPLCIDAERKRKGHGTPSSRASGMASPFLHRVLGSFFNVTLGYFGIKLSETTPMTVEAEAIA